MIAVRQFLVLLAALRRSFFQKELGSGIVTLAGRQNVVASGVEEEDRTRLLASMMQASCSCTLDMRAVVQNALCPTGDYGNPCLQDGLAGVGASMEGGTLRVLRQHEPVQEHACYHELCRLLGKINVKLACLGRALLRSFQPPILFRAEVNSKPKP